MQPMELLWQFLLDLFQRLLSYNFGNCLEETFEKTPERGGLQNELVGIWLGKIRFCCRHAFRGGQLCSMCISTTNDFMFTEYIQRLSHALLVHFTLNWLNHFGRIPRYTKTHPTMCSVDHLLGWNLWKISLHILETLQGPNFLLNYCACLNMVRYVPSLKLTCSKNLENKPFPQRKIPSPNRNFAVVMLDSGRV